MSRILRSFTVLCTLLLSVSVSRAQQFFCSEVGAVPVDTLSVSYTPEGDAPLAQKLKNTQEIWEILVLRGSSGNTSLTIPVESIWISGSGADSVDNVAAAELMELIDQVSVLKSLSDGTISSPAPGHTAVVQVFHTGAVNRFGQGAGTRFAAATGECAVRNYKVETPVVGGTATVTLLSANGPTCSLPLESTWSDSVLPVAYPSFQ